MDLLFPIEKLQATCGLCSTVLLLHSYQLERVGMFCFIHYEMCMTRLTEQLQTIAFLSDL